MITEYLVQFAALILSFLAILILLVLPKTYQASNRYLVLSFLGWFLFFLSNFLLRSKVMLTMPHVYRLFVPVYLTIGPFSFLYVRSILKDNSRLFRQDALHFFPGLLLFLSMLPFYVKTAGEKRNLLQTFYNFSTIVQPREGLSPPYVNNSICSISIICYGFLIIATVKKFCKKNPTIKDGPFKQWFQWIRVYCSFLIIPFVFGIGLMLVSLQTPIWAVYNIIYYLLSFLFALVVGTLFFHPSVLYGLPGMEPANINSPEQAEEIPLVSQQEDFTSTNIPGQAKHNKSRLTDEKIIMIAGDITAFFEKEQPYLTPGFSLPELSNKLKYPTHVISAVINMHFQTRFTDLINQYRIEYIIKNKDCDQWKSLTLEAIAEEAGFNSRSTFVTAFKKRTGRTPSTYLSGAD